MQNPRRATDIEDWSALLDLIRRAFATMEGRIDPPSSLHRLTPEGIARQARDAEVWLIDGPVACVFFTPRSDALYIGKLAVDPSQQGRGLGRRLLALAEDRARALHLPVLELETRVELTENQTIFATLGFRQVAATAHEGYDRPTSLTFQKTL